MINSDAFTDFWYMKFACNVSTQDNVITIFYKIITCWEFLFSYIIKDTYRIICNKISILILLENRFLGDLLVAGIFGRAGILILFVETLSAGFREFINRALLTLKLLFKKVDTFNKWIKTCLLIFFSTNLIRSRDCGFPQ